MDIGRFLIETHLRTGRPIKELAKTHGVSRELAVQPCCTAIASKARRDSRLDRADPSRARRASPTCARTRSWPLRKELLDVGASTPGPRPSTSTWVERRRRCRRCRRSGGCSRPEASSLRSRTNGPRARCSVSSPISPTSAGRPTSPMWRSSDGDVFEVLNIIDDHSRLCVASRVFVTVSAPDVVRTLHRSAATWGYPAAVLTDNGADLHRAAPLRTVRRLRAGTVLPGHRHEALDGPTTPRPAARSSAFTRP